MTNSTLEKVARAIWTAREMTFEPRLRRLEPDDIDFSSGAFALCMIQARAALQSLRQVDDETVEAMRAVLVKTQAADLLDVSAEHLAAVFAAGLDSILTEGGE